MYLLDTTTTALLRAHARSFAPTVDQQLAFDREQREQRAAKKPHKFSARAGDAVIDVRGILVPRPSLMLALFGQGYTVYSDILDAAEAAEADPAIKRLVLNIDSPGGAVAGLFQTLSALGDVRKPMIARATSALSAGYAIAATADKIEAIGRDAAFGSVGVAADIVMHGDEISIVNSDSPAKRPNLSTEQGRAVIVAELDQVATLLYESVARGRSKASRSTVTTSTVRTDFGRGAVLLADAALAAKMIDTISAYSSSAGAAAAAAQGDLGDQVAARMGCSRMADAVDLDSIERPAAAEIDDSVPTFGTGRLPTYYR